MVESDYSKYVEYVKQICDSGNLDNFKNSREYGDILEHVSYEHGLEYLECINKQTPYKIEDIILFCLKNDSVGSPHKEEYFFNGYGKIKVSPTSLRYVYQSHLILSYFKTLTLPKQLNLVEIGGGYGGLCVAINFFSSYYKIEIDNYIIIDLKEVIQLQEMFHKTINMKEKVQYVDASSYGQEIDNAKLFCISNYCYSEISNENQHGYCYYLFPKVSHGFMCWNNIRPPCLPFEFREEREIPNTEDDGINKFIYF